ncbi:hypothetical protein EAF04_001875 [Stromatinia cepivora]|nr:hypothetical protein EAF04_001875 [Stromatinia cepivora]
MTDKNIASLQARVAELESEIIGNKAIIAFLSQNQKQNEQTATALPTRLLPDPPIFEADKNGKHSMDFEDWMNKIQMKIDGDNYKEATRLAYIISRVGIRASVHIREKNFGSADIMLGYLKQVYGNPFRREVAEKKYLELKQEEKIGTFETFWTEFLILATELDVKEEKMMVDFSEKVNSHVKRILRSGGEDIGECMTLHQMAMLAACIDKTMVKNSVCGDATLYDD